MIGGARKVRRRKDPEPTLVFVETRLVELGDLLWRLALGEGRRDDLVLASFHRVLAHVPDVGDVLDRDHGVTEMLERPAQPIREQIRTQVAEVYGAIDRRTARVHAHLAGPLRGDRDDAPLEGVVDAELHGLPCDERRPVSIR